MQFSLVFSFYEIKAKEEITRGNKRREAVKGSMAGLSTMRRKQ
jgi:hypothetical protein